MTVGRARAGHEGRPYKQSRNYLYLQLVGAQEAESYMRVRPWPSRPFKLRNVGIVGWCLLAAALVQPSRQFGAPVDGTADRTTQTAPKIASQRPSKAQQARAVAAYGKLPLGFEANQGQSNSRVRFLSRGSGYLLYLTPDAAVPLSNPSGPSFRGGPPSFRRRVVKLRSPSRPPCSVCSS